MTTGAELGSFEHLTFDWKPTEFDTADAFQAAFDLGRVPTAPGCYLMHDAKGRVVYVGKANNLRSRVRAYINESDSRYMVKFLMRRVTRIDFLITSNGKEALLLENSLIKQYKPRYNMRLRDDKTYVSLRVNVKHEFPRVTVTRTLRKDGSKYFGPYSSAQAVRTTVRQLQRLFPLRTCSDSVLNNRTRPCLYYQMKRCAAPCMEYIDRARYREIVDQVVLLLDGRNAELEKLLLTHIQEHADTLEYEKAAVLRDRLYALRTTLERQRTVDVTGREERDVWGVYTRGRFSEIQVLFFRGGKMVGGRSFSFNQRETSLDEVISSFLLQYYSGTSYMPGEILVPIEMEERDVLAEILSEEKGAVVKVLHPQRGNKRALIGMANRNAKSNFEEKQLADKANKDLLDQVRTKLRLRDVPQRIECFDISTTQGAKAVGAMVTFEGGAASKSRYRRYSIKQVEGQDDFAMMREVLMRRFKRAIEEDDLPNLVLIDGGKGQLGVATTVFKDLGIDELDVISIAKSRSQGERARSPERFFVPGRMNPVILPQHSPVVLYLAQIRDEAHRFAITYHRKRRSRAVLSTSLTDIPGVGPKRAKVLLKKMGSLAKVRSASTETIAALPGFSMRLAESIKMHLGTAEKTARAGG